MTSNLGGEQRSDGLGFQPMGKNGQVQEALQKFFRPEFLGRLDSIICFSPLQDAHMEGIARKYLTQLRQRAATAGVQLQLPDQLALELGREGKRRGGARHLRHLVQEKVEGPLSSYLLTSAKQTGKVQAQWQNGEVVFS
jgi:ATP-dependent Clp protease ATP-binding subunit ClpA